MGKRKRFLVALLIAAALLFVVHLQSDASPFWILMYPGYLIAILAFSEDVHGGLKLIVAMYMVSFVIYTTLFYFCLKLVRENRNRSLEQS